MLEKHERGLFTPDSMLWKVHRENIAMLAGSRALMLELAHPLVAAGVAAHSDFRHRPLRRLFNTLRVMQRLSFGNRKAALNSAKHIHECHHTVKGIVTSITEPVAAGTRYDANDPALRLWVFATLMDSVLVVHDRFVHALNDEDRASFYNDALHMGYMMGLAPAVLPPNYEAFTRYFNAMLTDGTLAVGDTAREIMDALFSYPIIGLLLRWVSFPGIGLLPDSVRLGFGIEWSDRDQRWLDRLVRLSHRIRPLLPDLLAVQPDAWYAERTLYRAQLFKNRIEVP